MLIDFNKCAHSLRAYGGSAGRKQGVIFKGKNYLLKFPGSTSDMQNVNISYTNSPLSEYIGSHIYEILDIPVHKTILGFSNNKLVVACEDFLSDSDKFYEFAQLKVTFIPPFLDSSGEITNGTGTDIEEILLTIKNHEFLNDIARREDFFWDMFVVDSFIGNPDRNNGNWGIILHKNKTFSLAPVYDNGNSFNNKWDDAKIKRVLEEEELLKKEVYDSKTCIFTLKNKRINPYHLIMNCTYEGCNFAIKRIVPKIQQKFEQIKDFINSIPNEDFGYKIISETQKEFFTKLLEKRFTDVLLFSFKKLGACR